MKIKGDKNRELETFADKESRSLTRRVHRMKRETALQREVQLQIMREYSKFCENEFRMKHL